MEVSFSTLRQFLKRLMHILPHSHRIYRNGCKPFGQLFVTLRQKQPKPSVTRCRPLNCTAIWYTSLPLKTTLGSIRRRAGLRHLRMTWLPTRVQRALSVSHWTNPCRWIWCGGLCCTACRKTPPKP